MDNHIGTKIGMAIFGGILIAVSSSINYLFFGKITGLSGYLYNVLGFKFGPLFHLRLCFLVGMITVVDLYYNFSGRYMFGQKVLDAEEDINIVSWILGGILIGYGTRWSGGCTSGHGVCGLPRFSKRSLIAVCIFMSFGIATASINSVIGPLPPLLKFDQNSKYYYNIVPRIALSAYQLAALCYIVFFVIKGNSKVQKISPLTYFVTGSIFGMGLLISGMCSRQKVLHFMTLNKDWDPSLMFVMGSAVGINVITFQYTIRKKEAFLSKELDLPDTYYDKGIFIGPAIFGVGWGLCGLCPAASLADITVSGFSLLYVVLIISGQHLYDLVEYIVSKNTENKSNEVNAEESPQIKYRVDSAKSLENLDLSISKIENNSSTIETVETKLFKLHHKVKNDAKVVTESNPYIDLALEFQE